MSLRSLCAITAGRLTGTLIRLLGQGAGITWAGEIALRIDPTLLQHLRTYADEIIVVVGTNGKTTTAAMISYIFENNNYAVIHNTTGANLKNGITGTFITHGSKCNSGKKCIAVLEVDEAEFPHVVPVLSPDRIVLLNLFRDQLDRYGEVNAVAEKWKKAIKALKKSTQFVVNADDPLIASLVRGVSGHVSYFGLTQKTGRKSLSHAVDSSYCPVCTARLKYKTVYLSHFGDWYCSSCKNKRPAITRSDVVSPLMGRYNIYNALAAVLTAETAGIIYHPDILSGFTPAFGRQEIFSTDGRTVQMLLSKNPAGFNESIHTVAEADDFDAIILALNDRIPDGTDVSWIWDVDFDELSGNNKAIICTGDRLYDMALRIEYERSGIRDRGLEVIIEPDIEKAIQVGLNKTEDMKKLYILPTYSAMLDIRKVLTGRKIL